MQTPSCYSEGEHRLETIFIIVNFLFLSALRSSSPPVKLYKHRVDGTEGSGASYGELPADIAMSYKPIAPAPSGSNHTPPGTVRSHSLNVVQVIIGELHNNYKSVIAWPNSTESNDAAQKRRYHKTKHVYDEIVCAHMLCHLWEMGMVGMWWRAK